MAFALAALQAFLACKFCRWAALGVLAGGIFFIAVAYVRHDAGVAARQRVIAELQAATNAESERRRHVIEDAQAEARQSAERIAVMEKNNARLQVEIARLAAARANVPCLDDDSLRQLNQVGRPAR